MQVCLVPRLPFDTLPVSMETKNIAAFRTKEFADLMHNAILQKPLDSDTEAERELLTVPLKLDEGEKAKHEKKLTATTSSNSRFSRFRVFAFFVFFVFDAHV